MTIYNQNSAQQKETKWREKMYEIGANSALKEDRYISNSKINIWLKFDKISE
jgi:hypothetical protein